MDTTRNVPLERAHQPELLPDVLDFFERYLRNSHYAMMLDTAMDPLNITQGVAKLICKTRWGKGKKL